MFFLTARTSLSLPPPLSLLLLLLPTPTTTTKTTGCEFCSDCCECFERYPTEIHSANSHRLTLYSNCMVFERDAHDRPIVTHWTTTDKYGNVTHHQGERMRFVVATLSYMHQNTSHTQTQTDTQHMLNFTFL